MSMRSLFALILAAMLAISVVAQQQQTPANEPPQQQSQPPKKPAKQPQQPKPEEPAAKPTEPAPSQPEPKQGDDKKEEHFDMTEVAPVVTHHQMSLDGKTVKYTATTGRFSFERRNGKSEPEVLSGSCW